MYEYNICKRQYHIMNKTVAFTISGFKCQHEDISFVFLMIVEVQALHVKHGEENVLITAMKS